MTAILERAPSRVRQRRITGADRCVPLEPAAKLELPSEDEISEACLALVHGPALRPDHDASRTRSS